MTDLGSRLAQRANQDKADRESRLRAEQELADRKAATIAANIDGMIDIFAPHLEAYNRDVATELRLSLRPTASSLFIEKMARAPMWLEVSETAVYFKRASGAYEAADDFFFIGRTPEGAMTFTPDAPRARPLTGEQFMERTVLEILGLTGG